MNTTWRILFLAGSLLLGFLAIYAIWFETLAPEVFVKAFLSIVVVGFVLTLIQSALKKPSETDHKRPF